MDASRHSAGCAAAVVKVRFACTTVAKASVRSVMGHSCVSTSVNGGSARSAVDQVCVSIMYRGPSARLAREHRCVLIMSTRGRARCATILCCARRCLTTPRCLLLCDSLIKHLVVHVYRWGDYLSFTTRSDASMVVDEGDEVTLRRSVSLKVSTSSSFKLELSQM